MVIEKAIDDLKNIKDIGRDTFKIFMLSETITPTLQKEIQECLNMAIHALEMQKKLAEFSGMDICNLVKDYNYDDEENISEYVYEADVDDFLIDEIDEETEKKENKR